MSEKVKKEYIPAAWEEVPCPFCGHSGDKLFERFGSRLQYTYKKCGHCGLIYQSPRPRYDQHFIDSAYASYYQYVEGLKLEDLKNISESSMEMFKKELAYITQYDKSRTAVLDIGSGTGSFLHAAKDYYENLVGLDVSRQMAAFVKTAVGVDVQIEQFENFEWHMPFSLIHMSHVIEHIPNPNEWLQHAKKLLAKDGVLVVNIPHKYGLDNRIQYFFYKMGLKKQVSSGWNDPSRTPDHLYEPTIRSFKMLLEKNGFKILEHYTYSRKDPSSTSGLISRIKNRRLQLGSNITFITKVAE